MIDLGTELERRGFRIEREADICSWMDLFVEIGELYDDEQTAAEAVRSGALAFELTEDRWWRIRRN